MTTKFGRPIVAALRATGNTKCLEKAEALEQQTAPFNSLNLRSLDLNESTITLIANSLTQQTEPLQSISFSYNTSLGDEGAIVLSENLSGQICEIGLVNCGIGDAGGAAILNWMENAPKLRMICIEGNDFSEKLKSAYRKFSSAHPQVLVVV